jgi:hypothetical protein
MGRSPRSTANFISYDLRPAKQSERRILIELLKVAEVSEYPINEYRYVGMGTNRFYDFLLIHKYIGIKKMISLEHDTRMFKRAKFNCPYSFIDVLEVNSSKFIFEDSSKEQTIYWFDYDGGIGIPIINDINSLAPKIKLGEYFFITTFGGAPGLIESRSEEARLIWLQENLGDLANSVNLDDVQTSTFTAAVHKVLINALKNAFSPRRDGRFFPFFQIEYVDSLPMITVGGAFLSDVQIVNFKKKIKSLIPFLSESMPKPYKIRSLHLTERERALFDRATTHARKRTHERNQLEKIGFLDTDISAYRELLRYIPRYVETIV